MKEEARGGGRKRKKPKAKKGPKENFRMEHDSIAFFARAQAEMKDVTVTTGVIALQNGFLVLVTDRNKFGLGTLMIGIPPNEISDKAVGSPISMFGLKYTTLTNILGKKASKILQQPVLCMVFLQDQSLKPQELQKVVMDSFSRALETAQKNLASLNDQHQTS